MKLSRAVSVLSLLSVATSLSTSGQNPRHGRQGRSRTSPFPSDRSTSSTTGRVPQSTDVFSGVMMNDTRKQQKRRKRSAVRPPLVDSALLRFLSKQKRLKEESSRPDFNIIPSMDQPSSNGDSNDSLQATNLSLLESLEKMSITQQQIQVDQSLETPPQQSIPADSSSRDSADSNSPQLAQQTTQQTADLNVTPRPDNSLQTWMGQFNRNRVAKLLVSVDGGVDESIALQAGEAVQRHVLARTARRRVREFLKERDSLWTQGISSETSNGGAERQAGVSVKPCYSLADVVDLLMERGLTAKDVAAILIHTPSIALMMPKKPDRADVNTFEGESIDETMERAFSGLLCGRLKLRRYDARKVLRHCPGLLTKRGSTSAQQVVATLSKLGVSASSIARDKNALPTLLSRSPAGLFRLIAFLGSDAIRMPVNRIGPLLRRAECLELLNAVAPVSRPHPTTITPRTGTGDEGMSVKKIDPAFVGRTMEERRRQIDDTYDKMSRTAWTIRNEIGTSDLGKVIAAYPSVLLLDASKQVLPVASYLMEELGIWEDDLARVLQLYPGLLGMPISKMQSVVDFIVSHGVEEDNLASIFRAFPSLLTLEIESDMMPIVRFLRSIGIKNIGRFISRLPPVLGYSVERELAPKWEFIQGIYTYPSFELSKFPAYFSYPIGRIKSRFEYLRDVKRLPVSLIAPDLVLRYGDKEFAVKVAGDGDDGAGYSEFIKNTQQAGKGIGRNQRQHRKKSQQRKNR